jgi:anti-anti-sigma regulatory factor
MSTIKIYDGANEVRIEIVGRFQAESVNEVTRVWRSALGETQPRKCIVDFSRISGYDTAGCKLLRDMYHHGTQIAAGTPMSLVFLNEISTPRRRGPALVRERPAPKEASSNTSRLRPAAAGE